MGSRISILGYIRMFDYILIGALLIAYGRYVRSAATGTNFYVVFLIGGVILFGFAACVPLHVWGKLPKWSKITFLSCVFAGIFVFVIVEALILRRFSDPEEDVDYLIVLGAQVKEDGPSLVLKYRLDKAAEYLQAHPDTVCIVSGGQGENEPFPEADGMYQYLTGLGIDGARILREDRSKNTSENLEFCLKMLPDADVKVGIVTNNFHIFRSLAIAEKKGYTNAKPIVAPSKKEFLPTNMLREFVGVMKDLLFGNM